MFLFLTVAMLTASAVTTMPSKERLTVQKVTRNNRQQEFLKESWGPLLYYFWCWYRINSWVWCKSLLKYHLSMLIESWGVDSLLLKTSWQNFWLKSHKSLNLETLQSAKCTGLISFFPIIHWTAWFVLMHNWLLLELLRLFCWCHHKQIRVPLIWSRAPLSSVMDQQMLVPFFVIFTWLILICSYPPHLLNNQSAFKREHT